MATVWIPRPMQVHTQGRDVVEVDARNVRQLIEKLEEAFPGMQAALLSEDRLRPGIAVAVDGQVTQLGLLQTLSEENEVFFLPAVSGG